MLKNTGASSAIAGDVVGHDSEAMQRNYTKIDVETKRQALDKLPDLLGWLVDVGGGGMTGKIQERDYETDSDLRKNDVINWSRDLSTLFLKNSREQKIS